MLCCTHALTRVRAAAQRPDAGVDRHLYSLVTMRFDGTYNKLYTGACIAPAANWALSS